jgi:hypothetical protein
VFAVSFPSFSMQPNRTLAFSEKISFTAELVLLDDQVKYRKKPLIHILNFFVGKKFSRVWAESVVCLCCHAVPCS